MVVRVRLRIRSKHSTKSIVKTVLANGGAESQKPCIVVDPETARELGLWPLQRADVYSVEEASTVARVYLLADAVKIDLLGGEGKVLSSVDADLVVQEGLLEPLITDVTIDELGIQVISFGRGLWRHKGDPPSVVRRSSG